MTHPEFHEDVRHHYALAVGILRDTLKGLLLVNAGSAVALIAMAGVAGRAVGMNLNLIAIAVIYFGFGAIVSVLASAVAYEAQLAYARMLQDGGLPRGGAQRDYERYGTLKVVAWVLSFAALVVAGVGMFWAARAVGAL
jgi:hypothetical protein